MLLGVTASLLVAVAASQARAAVVDAAPTWPIPADAPAGPPPIPALPAATDAPPPAEQIADPVTPAASCGGWYLQSSYGSRWPAGSSWWEYRCTSDHYLYYDPCPGPACDAFCPSCYVDIESHTDYFYWNGVDAAFYGQDYFYSFYYTQVDYPPGFTISAWWDTPTARWYDLGPYYLTVSTDGTGSGEVSSSPAGISCGYSCEASFTAGTAITLTATPDAYSIFTGWLGDCSGTGSCQVTIDQARSVTATFALNAPPHASFTVACAGLSCSFDGSGSADSDGSIATYAWDFGDGASGSGQTVSHAYGRAGSYTVTLTVTDNAGATATDSKAINPISLSARGYKLQGLQKADLSWSGPSGTSFDLYRSGLKIATVQTTAYTDNLNTKGSGSYTYKVCEAASTTCSNDATVSF
jgi:PKD repeat protein